MKNLLIILIAISLTVGGCTSRTYVNRISPRQRYDRNDRHHDNHQHDSRYERGYNQRNNGPYRY